MDIQRATGLARDWLDAHTATLPRFQGAYLAGSAAWLPAAASLSPTSDLDLMIVLDDPHPPPKPGKVPHRGLLLDVTYVPAHDLTTPERVLADYHLAGPFRTNTILADPTGRLHALQTAVARDFARPDWVHARIDHAATRVRTRLTALDPATPLHLLVMGWAFATGVTCHVLLVAVLRNPTIRTRYAAARELLADHGRLDVYEDLLGHLGCAHWTAADTTRHLDTVTRLFDDTAAAAEAAPTGLPFASDITAAARPIAIDGSRALIDAGHHRDAVFWLIATQTRCLAILHRTDPRLAATHTPGFRALLSAIGIDTPTDLLQRARDTVAALPHFLTIARSIVQDRAEPSPTIPP